MDLQLSIKLALRNNVDALANPVIASAGIGVALLPLTRLGAMSEKRRDGEGSPGEEDIAAVAGRGGVTAIGEREGGQESTTVAIANLTERNLRSKRVRHVRIESS